MEQNVCLINKVKAAVKKAACHEWRQKYQDSMTKRGVRQKPFLDHRQAALPGCKAPATVEAECAAFVAESLFTVQRLEIFLMADEDSDMPEKSTIRSEHGRVGQC
jgi:hypothetical protein